MKRTTKKLSGIGLKLFLQRFYGSYAGIDEALAQRLSEDGAKTFASVRLRRLAWRDGQPASRSVQDRKAPPTRLPATQSTPATARPQPATPPAAMSTDGDTPFDPYAIGLVPVYQREGAEGLGAKLAAIPSLTNLRKMARMQQVALPAELRGDDADIEAVRAAIISAVAKRIANRRAAAG